MTCLQLLQITSVQSGHDIALAQQETVALAQALRAREAANAARADSDTQALAETRRAAAEQLALASKAADLAAREAAVELERAHAVELRAAADAQEEVQARLRNHLLALDDDRSKRRRSHRPQLATPSSPLSRSATSSLPSQSRSRTVPTTSGADYTVIEDISGEGGPRTASRPNETLQTVDDLQSYSNDFEGDSVEEDSLQVRLGHNEGSRSKGGWGDGWDGEWESILHMLELRLAVAAVPMVMGQRLQC